MRNLSCKPQKIRKLIITDSQSPHIHRTWLSLVMAKPRTTEVSLCAFTVAIPKHQTQEYLTTATTAQNVGCEPQLTAHS